MISALRVARASKRGLQRFASAPRNARALSTLVAAAGHDRAGNALHFAVIAAAVAAGSTLVHSEGEDASAVLPRGALARLLRTTLTTVRSDALGEPGWASPLAIGLARVVMRTPAASARAADTARRAMAKVPPTPLDVEVTFPGATAAEVQAMVDCSGLTQAVVPGSTVGMMGRDGGGQWRALGEQWAAGTQEVRITHTGEGGEVLGIITVDVIGGALIMHVPSSGIARGIAQCLPAALAAAWMLRLPGRAPGAARHLHAPLPDIGVGLAHGSPLLDPTPEVAAFLASLPPSFTQWLLVHADALAGEWAYWRAAAADVDLRVLDGGGTRAAGAERGPNAALVEEGRALPPIQHSAAQLAWGASSPHRLDWLATRFLTWLVGAWAANPGAPPPPEALPPHLTPWTASSGFTPLPPHIKGAMAEYLGRFLGTLAARRDHPSAVLASAMKALVGEEVGGDPHAVAAMKKQLAAMQREAASGRGGQRDGGRGEHEEPPAVVHGEEVPPELASLPCEVYTRDSHVAEGVGWGDLVGYPAITQAVQENILLPRQHPDVFAAVAAAARGESGKGKAGAHQSGVYLFAGPPGTGKTTTARVIAAAVEVPLVCLSFESIASALYGKSQKALDKVLRTLSTLPQGAVLFVDEADTFFPHRGRSGGHTSDEYDARHLSIFLKWLEGIDAAAAARITVVLATNRESSLDPALLSRVALTLQFDLPDAGAREAIWGKYAHTLSPAQRQQLVDATDGFSARDILRATQLAERRHATRLVQGGGVITPTPPDVDTYLECVQDKEGGVATSGGDGGRRRGAVPRSGQYSDKL